MWAGKAFRYARTMVNAILFLSMSIVEALSPTHLPPISSEPTHFEVPHSWAFSSDKVLDLLQMIENDDLENRFSHDDLFKINSFLSFLARQGVLPNDQGDEIELEYDIQELLETPQYDLGQVNLGHSILSAWLYPSAEVMLCKHWVNKLCKNTKKFVKKHKTAIIIGAVVVVAVVAVVVVVSASAGAAVVGAVAGGAAAMNEENGSHPECNHHEYNCSPEGHAEDPQNLSPTLYDYQSENIIEQPLFNPDLPELTSDPVSLDTTIKECVSSFKDYVVEENLFPADEPQDVADPMFKDRVREMGSLLTHEILDSVSQIVIPAAYMLDEVRDISDKMFPSLELKSGDENSLFNDPIDSFEGSINSLHQKIDETYSTDFSYAYKPAEEGSFHAEVNKAMPEVTRGEIPLPGSFGGPARLLPTQASSTCGWTVGKPINNRTASGKTPKWDTVRSRYWKNEAEAAKANPNHPHRDYIDRMERGLAAQQFNRNTGKLESIELHHIPPQREGGLFDFIEVSPAEHAELDKYRKLGKK